MVTIILAEEFPDYTTKTKSMIGTAVLVGVVLGQVLFGLAADAVGWQRLFILSCILLTAGGIACTAVYSPDPQSLFVMLAAARFILGRGIGGEYPLSATVAGETATAEHRGRAIGMVPLPLLDPSHRPICPGARVALRSPPAACSWLGGATKCPLDD